jgi:hypothetical protein
MGALSSEHVFRDPKVSNHCHAEEIACESRS